MFRMCWISWKQWSENMCHCFIKIFQMFSYQPPKTEILLREIAQGRRNSLRFVSKLFQNDNKQKEFCSNLFTTTSKAKEITPQILKNISKNDPVVSFPWKPQIYLKVPPGATFESAGKSASHYKASSQMQSWCPRYSQSYERNHLTRFKNLSKRNTMFGYVRTNAKSKAKFRSLFHPTKQIQANRRLRNFSTIKHFNKSK